MRTLGPTAADLDDLLDAQVEPPQERATADASAGVLDDLWDTSDPPFPGLSARRAAPSSSEAAVDAVDDDPSAPANGTAAEPSVAGTDTGAGGPLARLADVDAFLAATNEAGSLPVDPSPALTTGFMASSDTRTVGPPPPADEHPAPSTESGLRALVDGAGTPTTGPDDGFPADGQVWGDDLVVPRRADPSASPAVPPAAPDDEPVAAVDGRDLAPDHEAVAAPDESPFFADIVQPVEANDLDLVLAGRRSTLARLARVSLPHPRPRRARSDEQPVDDARWWRRPSRTAVIAIVLVVVAGLLGVAAIHHGGGTNGSGTDVAARTHVPSSHPGGSAATSSGATTSTPKSSLPKSALVPPTSAPTSSPTSSSGTSSGSGTGTGGVSETGPLTTSSAQSILLSLWQARDAAFTQGSAAALAGVDTGAALDGDTAMIDAHENPPNLDLSAASVVLLSTQTYPVEFLAAMPGLSTSGQAIEELAAISQSAAGGPWKLSLVIDVPSADASATSGSTSGDVGLSALDSLATAWQQWATTGTAPAGQQPALADSGAYTEVGQDAAEQVAMSSLQGLAEHVTFQPDTSFVVQTPASPGTICGAVQETAVFTSPSGAVLTQPASQATWGPELAPGAYRSVTEQSIYQVCMVEVSSTIEVFGGNGGRFATTGGTS